MKILYVSTHPHLNLAAPSGPGTHMREIINGFKSEGHEVITFIAGGESLDASTTEAIAFKKYSWKKWIPRKIWNTLKEVKLLLHNRKMKNELMQLVQVHRPNFIYERSYAFMDAACITAMKCNVPIICEVNAPYPEEVAKMNGKGLFHFFSEYAERYIARHAYRIVVVSSAMQQYFEQKHQLKKDQIIITPNAVDKGFAAVNEQHFKKIYHQIGLCSDDIVIGFVGSIFPYHGVDALIRAFGALKNNSHWSKLKLLIVGDGESLTELKELANRMNIREKIIFTGNVNHSDVAAYIQCMNTTVMAKSNWYGSPVKIFEYGILGKFIIAPDTIPVKDVMQHKLTGYIVANESELIDALNFAIDHPDVAGKIAATFKNQIEENHTWQLMAKKILSGK